MYGLTLDKDNRIEAIGVYHEGFPDDVVVVDTIPDGDHMDYLYVNGQYVYSPLSKPPEPEVPSEGSVWDELDAAYQEGVNSV